MKKENQLVKERKQYNRDAVEILLKIMEKYPSLRFLQILYNAKVIDKEGDFYNQEPTETFKKLFEYGTIGLIAIGGFTLIILGF